MIVLPGEVAGYRPGDVFQINERHGRAGWIGALVMGTKIKAWGIQGFVSHVESHDKQARAYIRLKWEELDYIGRAPLIPQDEGSESDAGAKPCAAVKHA